MKVLLAGLAPLLFAFGLHTAYPKSAFAADNWNPIKVYAPGCNAVVFTQIPDMLDLFIGRQINVTDPQNGCKGNGTSLVLLKMDWRTYRLEILRTILQTPAEIFGGRGRIDSAYDPYVAKFNGEYWVAFECTISGIPALRAGTCMGPFDPLAPERGIDLSRTYVPVYTRYSDAMDESWSASDPKLLTYGGKLYLYWSSIWAKAPPGVRKRQWLMSATRGMELVQEAAGQHLLWGKGAGRPVAAYDPSLNVEVWGVDRADPRSNQTADMFSVTAINGVIYATAGVGGNGCLTPAGTSPGCYRLAISVSRTPLGVDVFNRHLLPENLLPSNTQDYTRFFQRPGGGLCLMGHFYKTSVNADPSRALPEGIYCIPLQPDSPILSIGRKLAAGSG